ncbi:MAG: RNA polymerase sigma factor [Mycobacteriales bacterium]
MTAEHGFDEVLAAARLGQPWALSALFRSYAGSVAGYVRARSPAEPDDLVSEIFTSVFSSLDRFSGGEADFRGWLFTIAQRRVVDELRRRSRRVETTAYLPENDSRQVASAEQDSLDRMGEQWVRGVLDRLAPDQREVLLLRILGDLTVEQVSGLVGKSPGAVKALQRRGLAAAERIVRAEGVPL